MEPIFEHMVNTWVERSPAMRKVPEILTPFLSTHVDREELLLIRKKMGEVTPPDEAGAQEEADEVDEVYLGDDVSDEEDEEDD